MKFWCALGVVALFAFTGCDSLDTGPSTTDNSAAKTGDVPGEVIPNAPAASQPARTSPGWNW